MTRIGIRELGYRCRHKESSRLSKIELKKRTEDGPKDIVEPSQGCSQCGLAALPASATYTSVSPGRMLALHGRYMLHLTNYLTLFHLSLGRHYALE